MKKLLLILIILTSVVAQFSAQPPMGNKNEMAKPAKKSSLLFPHGNTINLGTFSGDSVCRGSLTVVNGGADPVAIISAFAECGCTRVSCPSDPIAPGDSVTVSVTYDPKGRPFGEFVKAVRLRPSTGRQNVFFVKGEIRRTYRRK